MLTAHPADETGEAQSRPALEADEVAPPDAHGPVLEEAADINPASPRPKRDYNYFADLRKELAKLRSAAASEDSDKGAPDAPST